MHVHPSSRLAAAVLALAVAAPARGQSAFGQLCDAANANCSPNVPEPPAPQRVQPDDWDKREAAMAAQAAARTATPKPRPALSMEQQLQVQLVGGLLQGLLSAILDDGSRDAAAQAAAAERQRQEAELLRQRAAAVQQQRAAREHENARSLEGLSEALSDPWVGNAGSGAVRMTGRGVVQPIEAPLPPPPPPPTAQEAASARLARLAAENADVAVLAGRLGSLEDRLADLRARTMALKREMNGEVRELDAWGTEVGRVVDDAYERGLSLATEGLFTLSPKALGRLGEVQSNQRAWNRLTGMLKEADAAAHGIKDTSELVSERLDDARWALGKRELTEDVKFLAGKLGGQYGELGGSILTSAQSIRTELQAMKAIERGATAVAAGPERLARLKAEYDVLLQDVKVARVAVSAATGIDAKDLVRGAPPQQRPTGIGSYVPPIDN